VNTTEKKPIKMATNNKKLTIKINLNFKLMFNILLKSKKKTLN